MQALLTNRPCARYCLNFIRRQPRIGYLAFDIFFTVLPLTFFRYIHSNKTFHVVFEKILEGLQTSKINSLGFLQSFQIYLVYRISVTLTILHSYVLLVLLMRKQLFGGLLAENNFISTCEILATILIFLASFLLPYCVFDIYEKVAFFGSLLFLMIQVWSTTKFLFHKAQIKQRQIVQPIANFFLIITTLFGFSLCAGFAFNLWTEVQTCSASMHYVNLTFGSMLICFMILCIVARKYLYICFLTALNFSVSIMLVYLAFLSLTNDCNGIRVELTPIKKVGQIAFGLWSILSLLFSYTLPEKSIIDQGVENIYPAVRLDEMPSKNTPPQKKKTLQSTVALKPMADTNNLEEIEENIVSRKEFENTEEFENLLHENTKKVTKLNFSKTTNHAEAFSQPPDYIYVLTMNNSNLKHRDLEKNNYTLNSLIFFHALMICASFFTAMLFTNWGSPVKFEDDSPNIYDFEGNQTSFWVKISTAWFNLIVHLLYLVFFKLK